MALRVVGAGLGRTGTNSLKLALEQLVGAPCYHMVETFGRPDHVAEWVKAVRDENPDWDVVFGSYGAAVDWPAAAFYEPLMHRYPDAVVLLSTRSSAEEWWASASRTIFAAIEGVAEDPPDLERMILDLLDRRFTPQWRVPEAAMEAYDRHNAEVRARVPAERLVEWQTGDGWEPLCAALAVPVPEAEFPHVNTAAEFRKMTGLD